ncbi:MAG: hypothetical protein NC926_03920 [Candidatus Omnitrophica bacterium]|nr:hypothetical protein [Candidatus Omnitrophota bacterium]
MFILNLLFFLLNSFLLAGIFGISSFIEFICSFIIFFYSQILTFSIILGLLKLLYPQYLLIFSVLLFFLILPHIKKFKLPEIKIIPKKIAIALSFVISCHILRIIIGLPLPPLETDGLLYHLPFAVHYYKTHSVSLPNLYFTDIAMTYYPIGGEIFYFFSLLSNKEFLLKYTQFPFLILGSFSLFLLSKSFGFSDFLSFFISSCFSLLKPVLFESSMCFVDLIMAATFISTLYFLRKNEKKYLSFAILSLSILFSVKTLSIIFGLLTIPFLIQKRKGKYSKFFYISIFHFLFFGLFSYWRNLILTRNPFYPAEIKIGKFILFKGAYEYPEISILTKIKMLSKILAFSSLHIDPSFNLKIILLLFFLISFALSFNKKDIFLFYLIFPVSIFLYCFLIPPHYYQIRHLLPVYCILSISLFHPFKKWEYFCIPVFLYIFFSSFKNIFIPKIFIVFFIFVIPVYVVSHFKKTLLYFILLLISLSFFIFEVEKTKFIYEKIKFEFWKVFYAEEGRIWEFIQRNSGKGKNIAYVGSFFIYPIYGDKIQNNLFYQSINSIDTLPIFKYRKKIKFPDENVENLYRNNPNFNLWLYGLKKKKVEWILVKKDKDYIEKRWIEENPELFRCIFSNSYAEIYEFLF